MKHSRYAVVKQLYKNSYLQYFKLLASTNIKTTLTFPRSAIWYSLRMNAGENFILDNKNLYPFNYKLHYRGIQEADNSPLNLSTKLVSSINELRFKQYTREDTRIQKLFTQNRVNTLKDNLINSFNAIAKDIEFNNEEDIDYPLVVYASLLYALGVRNNLNSFFSGGIKLSDDAVEKLIDLISKKIDYADSESLSQIMLGLVKTSHFDIGIWSKLLDRLSNVTFEAEHTAVTNKSPFLFRYVDSKDFLSRYLYGDDICDMFFRNQLSVFDAAYALDLAYSGGVGCKDNQNSLRERCRFLHGERFENYMSKLV